MAKQVNTRRPASLCWYCANAVPSDKTGCSWSREFLAVDGWDAVVTDSLHRNELRDTSIAYGKHAYLVKDCPQFIPDTPEFSRLSTRYEAGLNALALDVIKIAVVDLIPAYEKMLDVRLRRGYRFAQYSHRLLILRIPHQTDMQRMVERDVKAIRKRIYRLNHAREDIFPGVPKAKKAISHEVKRLYKKMMDMRIPSEERERAAYGSYLALRNFFTGDYAFHLSELDPLVLMRKVMRQIEDEMDIPQVEFIVHPRKKLKKGIRYGTGR